MLKQEVDTVIAERMVGLVNNNSVIREMFEEGKRLAGIYGAENVFDFSLGNPSVNPPEQVENVLEELLRAFNIRTWLYE